MDEWARKGATLSEKTAREEYGLTQEQIEEAIRAGTVQYRLASTHGNPWLRLLRHDIENLVTALHGEQHLKQRHAQAELARIDRELKHLRAQIAELEQRRSQLTAQLQE
jgi:transcriptional regulator with XRE-family HTH domain